MDLNWLRDFECLARTLNFTRAAMERNITQSAFSRRIRALESWVGLPLVNRATYPVQLTDTGRDFLPVAVAAISQLSEARQVMRDADTGDSRFIKFSVLHTLSVNFLSGRIEKLQEKIAGLRTRVISDSLSTCCDLLVEGAVDILVCYHHPTVSPQIDETVFDRKDLLVDRLIPVGLSTVVQAEGWALDMADGPAIPYLAYEKSSFLGMIVDHTLDHRLLNAETIYVDGLVEAIKRRVLAGSGFAWLPETAITTELASGLVVPVADARWHAALTISAYARPAALDPAAEAVWAQL